MILLLKVLSQKYQLRMQMYNKIKTILSISAFARDLKNYALGDVLSKIISIISIAIFTRILSVEDYGIYSVYNTSIAFLVIILTLGFHTVVSRYYFENKEDFASFVTLSFVSSVFLVSCCLPMIYFFKDSLFDFLNLPSSLIIFVYPALIVAIITSIFSQVYSSERKSASLTIVELAKTYLTFFIALSFLWYIEKSYVSLIKGTLIVGVGVSIFMLYKLRYLFVKNFKMQHFIYIVLFSIPLIPYHLSSLLLQQVDKIMINAQLGNYESGLYSFAVNIGMLYLMFTALILRAFAPDYFNLMNDRQYNQLDKKILKILKIYIIVALSLIYFGKEIAFVLADEKFVKATNIIPIIISGYVFFSIFEIYGRNSIYANKTIYSSINVLIPGVINIMLNNFLIEKIGYMGAAWATLISYLLMAFLAYLISVYIIKIHSFALSRLMVPMCFFAFSVGIYYVLNSLDISASIFFIAKFFIFCFIVFLLIRSIIKVGVDVQ